MKTALAFWPGLNLPALDRLAPERCAASATSARVQSAKRRRSARMRAPHGPAIAATSGTGRHSPVKRWISWMGWRGKTTPKNEPK